LVFLLWVAFFVFGMFLIQGGGIMSIITIILGHPAKKSYCLALAESYRYGAEKSGHSVHLLNLADLDFDPMLHSASNGMRELEPDLQYAQKLITESDHLVVIHPLWLGMMPALLKGFFERVFTPGFAYDNKGHSWPKPLLKGRTARVVITMGMPAIIYRWVFGAHSFKAMKSNMLKLFGFSPVRVTYLGMVDAVSDKKRKNWLDKMHHLGAKGK